MGVGGGGYESVHSLFSNTLIQCGSFSQPCNKR